jgi:hypothetical protein
MLWAGKPKLALTACRHSMGMLKNKAPAFYSVGVCLSASGHFKQARWFLEQAKQRERSNIRIAFSVLENSVRSGNRKWISSDSLYLFKNFDLVSIAAALQMLPADRRSAPVDIDLIKPIIREKAQKLSHILYTN